MDDSITLFPKLRVIFLSCHYVKKEGRRRKRAFLSSVDRGLLGSGELRKCRLADFLAQGRSPARDQTSLPLKPSSKKMRTQLCLSPLVLRHEEKITAEPGPSRAPCHAWASRAGHCPAELECHRLPASGLSGPSLFIWAHGSHVCPLERGLAHSDQSSCY